MEQRQSTHPWCLGAWRPLRRSHSWKGRSRKSARHVSDEAPRRNTSHLSRPSVSSRPWTPSKRTSWILKKHNKSWQWDQQKRKTPFLLCVNPPPFALCVLGDTSGGLQYLLTCHTMAPIKTLGLMANMQPARAQNTIYCSYCSLTCESQNVTLTELLWKIREKKKTD